MASMTDYLACRKHPVELQVAVYQAVKTEFGIEEPTASFRRAFRSAYDHCRMGKAFMTGGRYMGFRFTPSDHNHNWDISMKRGYDMPDTDAGIGRSAFQRSHMASKPGSKAVFDELVLSLEEDIDSISSFGDMIRGRTLDFSVVLTFLVGLSHQVKAALVRARTARKLYNSKCEELSKQKAQNIEVASDVSRLGSNIDNFVEALTQALCGEQVWLGQETVVNGLKNDLVGRAGETYRRMKYAETLLELVKREQRKAPKNRRKVAELEKSEVLAPFRPS